MYAKLMNESLNNVLRNYKILIKSLLIPFVLLLVVNYFEQKYSGFNNDKIILYFLRFIAFLLTVSIAVTTHRVLILKEEYFSKWTSREFKFLFNSIIIGVLVGFSVVLISVIGGFLDMTVITIIIAVIVGVYIFSRFSLVLPSIAVDEKIDLTDSWLITKDYKLLVFVIVGIFPIIVGFITSLVYSLALGFIAKLLSLDLNILFALLDLFISVLVISCLSTVYKFLKEKELNNQNNLD